ncbi:hypothetical protein LguiA_015133 [Lonicera macranthoides]
MAKGRSLTISRSERLLGSNYTYNHSHSHTPPAVTDESELGEDDVWSMVNGGDDYAPNYSREEWSPRSPSESNGNVSSSRRRHSPLDDGGGGGSVHSGGLSLAFDDSGNTSSGRILHQFRGHEDPRGRHVASSAPVNVPDWTKIYRVDSIESLPDSDADVDDQNSDMVPPHEYLARSRNSAANSVFEGVGRTLKGRDMSRVRDAVWSQTGFYG